MRVLICVSATEKELTRLTESGLRRDFLELARLTQGQLCFSPERGRRRGWVGRLFGAHLQQAWVAAKRAASADVVFADGEHIGIPLAVFLRLRRRNSRVVMLGHFVSKPWKRALLRLVSRVGVPGRVLVHSEIQEQAARNAVGGNWSVSLVPYQVDTSYWEDRRAEPGDTILAVGAEGRDYDTLLKAVEGLGLPVRIAAGSHWARKSVESDEAGDDVTWFSEPLPFDRLREEYENARLVVVPLLEVENQSGVTTVLEAMSMSRPVVLTATQGQREVVSGPLVRGEGQDPIAMPSRGAHLFGAAGTVSRAEAEAGTSLFADADGIYVPVGDASALRQAITLLSDDSTLARRIGKAGRETVQRSFTLESYAERLSAEIHGEAEQEDSCWAVGAAAG